MHERPVTSVHALLEAWRDAERAVEDAEPGSAEARLARIRADMAREDYHAAVGVEQERDRDQTGGMVPDPG